MRTRHGLTLSTAIFAMAVLFLGSVLSGCATSRHVRELQAEINDLEQQQQQTQQMVARMDSVVSAGVEENNRLRAEMSTTVQNLQQQLAQVLESNQQLMSLVNQLQAEPKVIVRSSPGASKDEPPSQTQPETNIDCTAAYDSAFILVLRTERDKAVEALQSFLQACPDHENVPNAHYWLGETYWLQDEYRKAVEQLETVVEEYPGSANLSRALFKLGRCYQELGQTAQAKEIYGRIVQEFPNTLESEHAADQLEALE
jgi:tol-pal system protein YbgF